MAYKVFDLDNNLVETLETEEQLQELFDSHLNVFWNDEGLAETLKNSDAESLDTFRIVEHSIETE